jgi:hypothetical protein
MNTFLIDEKMQIRDKILVKGGLAFLDLKVIGMQQLEYSVHML